MWGRRVLDRGVSDPVPRARGDHKADGVCMSELQQNAGHGQASKVGGAKKTSGGARGSRGGDSGTGELEKKLDEVIKWLKINAYISWGRDKEFYEFVRLYEVQTDERRKV